MDDPLCTCDHLQSEHFPDFAEREGLGSCQHEDEGCGCGGFDPKPEPDCASTLLKVLNSIWLEGPKDGRLWLRIRSGSKEAALSCPCEGIIADAVKGWNTERIAVVGKYPAKGSK